MPFIRPKCRLYEKKNAIQIAREIKFLLQTHFLEITFDNTKGNVVYKLQLGREPHRMLTWVHMRVHEMIRALSSKTYMGTSYQYNMGIMAILIRLSYFSNKTMII